MKQSLGLILLCVTGSNVLLAFSYSSYIPIKITKLCYYQDITKVGDVCGVARNTIPSSRKDVDTVKVTEKKGRNAFQQENSVYIAHYSCIVACFVNINLNLH